MLGIPRLVRLLREKRFLGPIAFTSTVGSRALAETIRSFDDDRLMRNIIVSQVVPPYYADDPGPKRYRAALEKYVADAQPGFVSFEGYLSASLFIRGLENLQGGLTVGTLMRSFESLTNVDLGFDPGNIV